jgi:dTDP-4-dehydrorhamnose 3,5-epimerase
MRFEQSTLCGVWVIELEPLSDERGSFTRTFDLDEFTARGIDINVVQSNVSATARRGTLRGMHYQDEPYGEPKLVRPVHGAAFHVALDLRRASPTYRRWHGIQLSRDNLRALYLPAGVAHGFQTLTDDYETSYHMGHRYMADAARGARWDDPTFAIEWPPLADGVARFLSDRDRSFPDWEI